MSQRMLCISWKDKRYGFTKRARWYANGSATTEDLHTNIRLCLEDTNGVFNFYPKTGEEAKAMWAAFKDGTFDAMTEWSKR